MSLAGQGQRHHGAAVEGVFEGDDGGALGIGASDLYGVLDSLRSAVDEEGFLGEPAGSDCVHALGQSNVSLIGRDLDAGVEEVVELSVNSFDVSFLAVTGVGAADASGKFNVAVAVHVFGPGVFGFGHINGRAVGNATGHGLRAAG